MEYRVLGPLELGGCDGPIVLEGRRERAVLSALVLGRGRVISTERLLEIVWGDSPPRSAAKTVQNHVLRLRKSLGADAIETREPGYRLVVDPGDIDADRFEQLAASGRAHLEASEPEAAAEAFRSARSLWRGRPFPELEESAEAAAEAQRLSELSRVVSEDLMAAELACGRHHAAVAELEALVAVEPLREARWAMLMLALYRSGRQADALRTYQRARALLGDELGIEPGPELRALELQVAAQDPALDLATDTNIRTACDTGLVLVLVADLGLGAAALESLGDEHAAELRRRTRARLRDTATRTGGRQLPVGGDELTVVYASAKQCLEAAIEMSGSPGPGAGGTRSEIRIGVHAGEPMSDGDVDDFGAPVSVARALRDAARPGQIVASDLVRELIGTRVDFGFDDIAAVSVDGLELRVPAVEVFAPDDGRPAPDAGEPPYQGLVAYEPEDAGRFFGREVVVAELVARVRSRRFLALVGASGTGKSSVLRAGLVASIRGGAFPGSESWPVLLITPSARPLRELGRAVEGIGAPDVSTGVVNGGADPDILVRAVRNHLVTAPAETRVFLVIDQFEELFTLCDDEAERRHFVDCLVAAATSARARVTLVIALRADFYGQCAAYPELRALVQEHTCLLGAMDAAELLAAVEGPAAVAGLRLEAGLSELVVRDVVDEPGGLPLLSHAMLATWMRRRRRTLTVEGYLATGGVTGAIAHTAESVYATFDPSEQRTARGIFLRLLHPGEGTEDTRRRAPLGELFGTDMPEEVGRVLAALADARLVTVDEDSAEVAHEALIRRWPRLRDWIDDDREGIRIHRHLTNAARDWDALARDDAELYRGPRLALAREWAARRSVDAPNRLEAAFLERSDDLERREIAAGEARARAQARSHRRLRGLLVGTSIALVVALVAGAVALGQRARANDEADAARAATRRASVEAILSASTSVGADDRALQDLLLVEAQRIQPGSRTSSALFSALLAEPRLQATLPVPSVAGIWPLADDHSAVLWTDGHVERRNMTTGKRLGGFPFHDVTAVAVSANGTMAVGTPDGAVHLVNARSRTAVGVLRRSADRPARFLAFSPDGTRLAVVAHLVHEGGPADPDGVRIYDTGTGTEEAATFPGHEGTVGVVAFSGDGSLLATGGNDGTVLVHDSRTGAVVAPPIPVQEFTMWITFDPFRPRLLVGDVNPGVSVWDLTSDARITVLEAPLAVSPSFDATGARLAVPGSNAVQVYDAASLQPIGSPLDAQHGSNEVAFADDGRLYVGGRSAPVTVWDPSSTTAQLFHAAPATESYLFPLRGGQVVVAPDLADSVTLLDAHTFAPLGPPLSPGVGSQHGATLPTTFAASYDDSRRIAVVNRDGVLQMYDVARRTPMGAPLVLHMASTYAVFSRDLRTIAVAGREGDVAIVDVSGRSPRLLHRALASPMRSYVVGLAFGPHNELYAADPGHLVRFDAVRTHEPRTRDLSGLVRGGSSVAFGMDLSPDGRTLAVSRDGTVELVDTKTLRRRGGGIPATDAPIAWLAFSRDGRHVVVNDDAASVRLVDVSAHRAIGPLWTGLHGAGAVFDHSGRHVGTSTTTSGALLDVGTREWRRDACALAGRNLTVEEWHRYLPGEGPRRRTCPQYG